MAKVNDLMVIIWGGVQCGVLSTAVLFYHPWMLSMESAPFSTGWLQLFLAAAWIFLSGGDVIAPYLIWFLIWHFFKMHKTLPKIIRLRNYKSHFQRNGHYFAFKNVIKMVLQSQVESDRVQEDRITKLNKNHIWKMFPICYETLRCVNAKTLKIVNLISSWHVAIGQWHQIIYCHPKCQLQEGLHKSTWNCWFHEHEVQPDTYISNDAAVCIYIIHDILCNLMDYCRSRNVNDSIFGQSLQ